ncbi:MAG: AbrB/MazE/SpoVT family DNA-binding domain-containing protein [Pseudomonadota bacterium]|nr:AbrB/MazE/SpoVT family DNA-binding domain-containing protein [Pseudomonadota bacterium]
MNRSIDVRVAPNGRMVLPRVVREALGVNGPSVVVLSLEGDEVKLTSARRGVARAQALYRANATADQSSDAFLAERRRESARDRAKEGGG